jgi:hypothetical protein
MARVEHGRLWVPTPVSLGSTIFGLAVPTFTTSEGNKREFSSEDSALSTLETEGWEIVSHSVNSDENWIYTTYVLKREVIEKVKPAPPPPPPPPQVPKIQLSQAEIKAEPTGSIPLINAKVSSFLFFEAGSEIPPYEERVFANRFPKATARYIFYQLILENPKPGRRVDFDLYVVYYRQDGSIFFDTIENAYVEANWGKPCKVGGAGSANPGSWSEGEYRVDIYFERKKIVSDTFTVHKY